MFLQCLINFSYFLSVWSQLVGRPGVGFPPLFVGNLTPISLHFHRNLRLESPVVINSSAACQSSPCSFYKLWGLVKAKPNRTSFYCDVCERGWILAELFRFWLDSGGETRPAAVNGSEGKRWVLQVTCWPQRKCVTHPAGANRVQLDRSGWTLEESSVGAEHVLLDLDLKTLTNIYFFFLISRFFMCSGECWCWVGHWTGFNSFQPKYFYEVPFEPELVQELKSTQTTWKKC